MTTEPDSPEAVEAVHRWRLFLEDVDAELEIYGKLDPAGAWCRWADVERLHARALAAEAELHLMKAERDSWAPLAESARKGREAAGADAEARAERARETALAEAMMLVRFEVQRAKTSRLYKPSSPADTSIIAGAEAAVRFIARLRAPTRPREETDDAR